MRYGCLHRAFTARERRGQWLAVFALGLFAPAIQAQSSISNTASVTYQIGATSAGIIQNSNTVSVSALLPAAPATATFYRYAPEAPDAWIPVDGGQYDADAGSGTDFRPLPPVTRASGQPLDTGQAVPLKKTLVFHVGEPIFLTVADANRNTNPNTRELIELGLSSSTGDAEWLRLRETGPDTGLFATAIQIANAKQQALASADGRIATDADSILTVAYQDPADSADALQSIALVDPYGVLFDSQTGARINGASITLLNADTGQPAQVYGDDGLSRYPATVVTGGSTTDSSGAFYQFPAGGYRFPFVQPGNYRFVISPPPGYTVPSTRTPGDLAADPDTSTFIVDAGSYGDAFVVVPGPALNIDIPADPPADPNNTLLLQKRASQTEVSAGDFLQYRLTLLNRDTADAINVALTDILPAGFRYQAGSLRVAGVAAEPAIGADGRTLGFAVGTVPADGTVAISYVAQVVTRQPSRSAINQATARADGGRFSNTALAAVRVREPLFSGAYTITGRVLEAGCAIPETPPATGGQNPRGVPNVRLLLDDGTYVTSDRDGLFHFEGVRPGTHVVQLDLDSLAPHLAVVPALRNSRFAGRSYSQFVDVQGGGLWRTDFFVCPRGSAQVGLRLSTSTDPDHAGRYTHRMTVDGGVPVKNLRVTVMLSGDASYQPGSVRVDNAAASDPEIADSALTFRLGDLDGRWARQIEFNTQAIARAEARRFTLRAEFDPMQATLKPEGEEAIRQLLARLKNIPIDRLEIIGHSDKQSVRNAKARYENNYALSRARAETVGDTLRQGLGLRPTQLQIAGAGPDHPIADNRTAAGRARNRRTEVRVYESVLNSGACGEATVKAAASFDSAQQASLRTPAVENTLSCQPPHSSGAISTASKLQSERLAVRVPVPLDARQSEEPQQRGSKRKAMASDVKAAGGETDWLAGAQPGIQWLFPAPDHNPRAPAVRAVIQHAPGQAVSLRINGEPVHPLNFDGVKTHIDETVAVSLWRGIPLNEGDNRLQAEVRGADGQLLETLVRTVHFANAPARAELVSEESILSADGIVHPVLAVRILDRDGRLVRAGVSGGFTLNPPYVTAEEIRRQQERQLAGQDRFQPTWRIEGDSGIAYIELQPTTASGEAVLNFNFQTGAQAGTQAGVSQRPHQQELRAWLAAAARDWVVVGFAEGTAGYTTLKDRGQALPPGAEDGAYTDGQVSLYAKGRVLGQWLLTLAYDTDKPGEAERRRSLLSTIDPSEYYTLYGDGAEQRYDASSQDKLYLKLERKQFYALFGDYETGLTQTQLSRYSRTLNGIKSELGGGPVVFTVFASETPQNFSRDEIRGDGTSGLYRLSRTGIVINSEKIRLETRDRLQSERVTETRTLQRHIDYDIDYSGGTLFFREPVPSRDASFNPIFVVAEYETFGQGDPELNAGGRAGLNLLGGKLALGLSQLREEQFLGRTDLTGADLKLRVGDGTELRLEGASSDGEAAAAAREGDAWLAEMEHHGTRLDTLVYSRRQDAGFGLNQQNGSETGTGKLGADVQYRLTEQLALQGQTYRQENLVSDATRAVANAGVLYSTGLSTLRAGYQTARDEAAGGERFESEQATFGASRWLFDKRLELQAGGDVGLSGKNDSLDFPSRYQIGAAYRVTHDTRLIVAQEYTDGEAFDTRMTRAGFEVVPWKGARLNSTVNQSQISEYGPRTFGQFGLTQALLMSDAWGADLSFDSSQTFNESGAPAFQFNPNQAPAIGGGSLTEDFVALSGGLTYRNALWSWNGRAEMRDASTGDRYGLTTGFLRQAEAGIAFAASAQAFQQKQAGDTQGLYGNASLSWAWRPLGSRWSVLDRLEFKYDTLDNGSGVAGANLFGDTSLNVAGDATARRLINNFNLNRVSGEWTAHDRRGNLFALQQRNQWSLYYGAKYAFDNFNGVDFSAYTDLLGLEWRYDLTPRWDIGLQASSLNSWKDRTHEYSAGPQIGFTPAVNSWISLGYNIAGFYDRDFDAARYTAEGPYLKLRFKFDQNTCLCGADRRDPRAMERNAYPIAADAGSVKP